MVFGKRWKVERTRDRGGARDTGAGAIDEGTAGAVLREDDRPGMESLMWGWAAECKISAIVLTH